MIEQGRGCRFCEVPCRDVMSFVQHGYNKFVTSCFGMIKASYAIWRCDKCGAYWSEYVEQWSDADYNPISPRKWFCFGRDVKDIKRCEDLYPKMVQSKRKMDWVNIFLTLALSIVLFMFFYIWMINLSCKRDIGATEKLLNFGDVCITSGNTTIIDFRSGYLTNHTVILFLENGNVIQYGKPKNLCYTSNTVSVVNP
jgi:hypothetical protein